MSQSVDQILADRTRRKGRRGETAAIGGALALHLLIVGVAFALPRLTPPPKPLEFVPVQIIPAQALGVRRPAPPRQKPAPPAPAEEKPAPAEAAPAPEARPEPAKPQDDIPVLPSPDKKKPETAKPRPTPTPAPTAPTTPAKPTTPGKGKPTDKPQPAAPGSSSGSTDPNRPAGTAPGETGDQLGRRGGPQGNPLGTTAFGSEVAGVDNPDFTYGYYLDRLLSLIDAQWARPNMGAGVKTVIFFRIARNGSMTELRVEQSSGYNSFDLAALRAVNNAAPFSPLPRAFQHDSLGVNLIVR